MRIGGTYGAAAGEAGAVGIAAGAGAGPAAEASLADSGVAVSRNGSKSDAIKASLDPIS